MDWTPDAFAELRALLGEDGVLDSEAARFAYETDALTLERGTADVVVLPRSTDEVAALVRWAHASGVPVTTRGAGTGLAGGATPHHGGLLLVTSRMDQVLALDPGRMFAWVQPGLVNARLSELVAPHGLHFAPDPSSQPVSTIGGNVAANAGGPHCLQHGVTANHVLGLVVVLYDGSVVTLGGEAPDTPDAELASVVAGSEGTLGILCEICVRLVPRPEAVHTMSLDFAVVEDACRAVSAVIAAGIVPAAMELMDRQTMQLIEAWLHLGLPVEAAAMLIIEVDGPAVSLPARVERITAIAREHGARSVRAASDAAARAALWRGRKSSFGAYGRTGLAFTQMDGTVPRSRLAEAVSAVYALAKARGLAAGTLMHAGDGNLHPHILYDPDDEAQHRAALEVSQEILRVCIRLGGTISGEHGIGLEKIPMMSEIYAPADLATMRRLRWAFDPDGRLNPGKVLPDDPAGGAPPPHARASAQPADTGTAHDQEGPWN
jgi:glycolate oxidase